MTGALLSVLPPRELPESGILQPRKIAPVDDIELTSRMIKAWSTDSLVQMQPSTNLKKYTRQYAGKTTKGSLPWSTVAARHKRKHSRKLEKKFAISTLTQLLNVFF